MPVAWGVALATLPTPVPIFYPFLVALALLVVVLIAINRFDRAHAQPAQPSDPDRHDGPSRPSWSPTDTQQQNHPADPAEVFRRPTRDND